MNISLRQEQPEDYHHTEILIEQAFRNEEMSDKQEHFLVQRIRRSDAFIPELSIVAVNQQDEIIGQILFQKYRLKTRNKQQNRLPLHQYLYIQIIKNKVLGLC